MQPYKFVINGTKLWETLRLETLFCYGRKQVGQVGRVIAIQEGNDGFVRRVNIVVGTNASKTFGTGILERPANKLVLLVESEDENNIEQ